MPVIGVFLSKYDYICFHVKLIFSIDFALDGLCNIISALFDSVQAQGKLIELSSMWPGALLLKKLNMGFKINAVYALFWQLHAWFGGVFFTPFKRITGN